MSSRSSSKRRKSRRSSSSRSSLSKKAAFAETSVAKDGIDFLALMIGLITGATLLLLLIGMFKKPEINPEILAATDQKLGEVVAKVESKDFKTFTENATTEKLVKTLDGLLSNLREGRKRVNFLGSQPYINICQRVILVADQLAMRKLTGAQRQLAAKSKLQTLGEMFWVDRGTKPLGVADLEIRLRETCQRYLSHANKEISRVARVEYAKLNSLTADRSVREHGQELYGLLKDFPSNPDVAKAVFGCLIRHLRSPESIPTAKALADYILSRPRIVSDDASERASAWSRISDLWQLCDRGYFELYESREFASLPALRQLTDICVEIAKFPAVGEEGVGQAELVAQWLEQNDHYELALRIYNNLLEAGSLILDPRVGAMAEEAGRQGKVRCEAVGKPFDLVGTNLVGQPIDAASMEGFPVLLVFWTITDRNVEAIFRGVETTSKNWRGKAVKIIAVQVEKDEDDVVYGGELVERIAKEHPDWEFCVPNADGSHPIFDQVPARESGRLILLDRSHTLHDVDVPVDELPTVVNSVLASRGTRPR